MPATPSCRILTNQKTHTAVLASLKSRKKIWIRLTRSILIRKGLYLFSDNHASAKRLNQARGPFAVRATKSKILNALQEKRAFFAATAAPSRDTCFFCFYAVKTRTSPGRVVRSTSTASPSCLRSSATPSSPFRKSAFKKAKQRW